VDVFSAKDVRPKFYSKLKGMPNEKSTVVDGCPSKRVIN